MAMKLNSTDATFDCVFSKKKIFTHIGERKI